MMEFQRDVDKLLKERGWEYWNDFVIIARLMEECGEFAEAVNHHFGEKKVRDGEKEPDVAEEIGDIFFTLICFANKHGIDLGKAIAESISKVTVRDKDRILRESGE